MAWVQSDSHGRENLKPPNSLPLQALVSAEDSQSSITLKTENNAKINQSILPGAVISREDAGSLQSPLPRLLGDAIPQMRIRSKDAADRACSLRNGFLTETPVGLRELLLTNAQESMGHQNS